jgi:hypothetical protein
MAAIKVQANTNGIGTVTLTAPNTNTDRTVTIPDVSGNVVISDGSLITADYTSSSLTFGGTVDFTSATVKGLGSWKIQNANNITLVAGDNVFANTRAGALTLNLPASATKGETIRIVDNEGLCSSNNITIGRNGHNIDGSARNAVLNVDRQGIVLVYESSRNGWVSKKKERVTAKTGIQGKVSGFHAMDETDPAPAFTIATSVDRFPFSSDTNATDVGDMIQGRRLAAGSSSFVSGYTAGGQIDAPSPTPDRVNTIEKFPFVAGSFTATDVGDLAEIGYGGAGQSSETSGYGSGWNSVGIPAGAYNGIIQKFPFATDTGGSDAGDLFDARNLAAGHSSVTHGYTSGGYSPGNVNVIDKFPFATDTNATDVADLTAGKRQNAGCSSSTDGYSIGGVQPAYTDAIDKFPFASDTNAVTAMNFPSAGGAQMGCNSTEFGYFSGGRNPPNGFDNTIEKFPFASDGATTNIGSLTIARSGGTVGQQV